MPSLFLICFSPANADSAKLINPANQHTYQRFDTATSDILGGFLDLNNSSFDYANNQIKLKFTVQAENLGNYFKRVGFSLGDSTSNMYVDLATIKDALAQSADKKTVVLNTPMAGRDDSVLTDILAQVF